MLVSKCIKSVSVEITFSEKDNPENEHVLTAFSSVLMHVIDMEQDEEGIEDAVLTMENVDIVFNKRKIITSMTKH